LSLSPGGSARFAARWFDGVTPEPREAVAEPDAGGVTVAPVMGASRHWRFDELVLVRGGSAAGPVQLERRGTPVEVLIVDDARFLAVLRSALPPGTQLAHAGGGTPVSWRLVLGLFAAAAALVAAAYLWIVPAFARFAADRVPAQWERSFGDVVVAELAPPEQRVTDPRITAPVQALHARLAASATGWARASRLVVLREPTANAFATPGGMVTVTTGLLGTLGSSDELAAVLAHELAHLEAHHPMRAVVRQLSLGALLALVAGDHSALSGALRTAGELGGLAYSRADERTADDLGMALLERNGIAPEALARALESLSRTRPGATGASFLSTHPAPRERIERIRAAARRADEGRGEEQPVHAAAADGWRRMREALADSLP